MSIINLIRGKLSGEFLSGFSTSEKKVKLDYTKPGAEDQVSIKDKDGNVTTGTALSARSFEVTEDISLLDSVMIEKRDSIKLSLQKIAAAVIALDDQVNNIDIPTQNDEKIVISEKTIEIIQENIENQSDMNIFLYNHAITGGSDGRVTVDATDSLGFLETKIVTSIGDSISIIKEVENGSKSLRISLNMTEASEEYLSLMKDPKTIKKITNGNGVEISDEGDYLVFSVSLDSSDISLKDQENESITGTAGNVSESLKEIKANIEALNSSVSAASGSIVGDPLPQTLTGTFQIATFSELSGSTDPNVFVFNENENKIDVKEEGTYRFVTSLFTDNADKNNIKYLNFETRNASTGDVYYNRVIKVQGEGANSTTYIEFPVPEPAELVIYARGLEEDQVTGSDDLSISQWISSFSKIGGELIEPKIKYEAGEDLPDNSFCHIDDVTNFAYLAKNTSVNSTHKLYFIRSGVLEGEEGEFYREGSFEVSGTVQGIAYLDSNGQATHVIPTATDVYVVKVGRYGFGSDNRFIELNFDPTAIQLKETKEVNGVPFEIPDPVLPGIYTFELGEDFYQGEVGYINIDDNKIYKARSTNDSALEKLYMCQIGGTAGNGNTTTFMREGGLSLEGSFNTGIAYLDDTGYPTTTKPTSDGEYVVRLGMIAQDAIELDIDSTVVKLGTTKEVNGISFEDEDTNSIYMYNIRKATDANEVPANGELLWWNDEAGGNTTIRISLFNRLGHGVWGYRRANDEIDNNLGLRITDGIEISTLDSTTQRTVTHFNNVEQILGTENHVKMESEDYVAFAGAFTNGTPIKLDLIHIRSESSGGASGHSYSEFYYNHDSEAGSTTDPSYIANSSRLTKEHNGDPNLRPTVKQGVAYANGSLLPIYATADNTVIEGFAFNCIKAYVRSGTSVASSVDFNVDIWELPSDPDEAITATTPKRVISIPVDPNTVDEVRTNGDMNGNFCSGYKKLASPVSLNPDRIYGITMSPADPSSSNNDRIYRCQKLTIRLDFKVLE